MSSLGALHRSVILAIDPFCDERSRRSIIREYLASTCVKTRRSRRAATR